MKRSPHWSSIALAATLLAGCGGGGDSASGDGSGGSSSTGSGADTSAGPGGGSYPPTDPGDGPPAGNPDGHCDVPADAQAEDTSSPRTVVGNGTPDSCTSAAVVDAVAKGGIITFDCGADPKTIVLDQTAKIVNDTGPRGS